MSATFARIIEEEPPALSKVRPQSLPALDRIVATCLRKNPVERYESTHLVTDFEQLELELAQLRQHASDRSGARPAAPLGAWRSAWWRTHQVMIIGLYVVAVSLSWYIKEWVKVPVTVAVFIGLGAGAIGGLLRGHLVFTQYFNWPNLTAQHRRVARALMVLCTHGLRARCRCSHAGEVAVNRDVDRGARDRHRTGCARARASHHEGGVRGYGCLVR